MNVVPVVIDWVRAEDGGRSAPPPMGDYWYRPTAHFDADPDYELGYWSFFVKPLRVSRDGHRWVADGRYLMDNAPQQLLQIGARFELLEGNRVVAHARVADPATADRLSPDEIADGLTV